MNKNAKEKIEGLKLSMLNLHRSAAMLDILIETMENNLSDDNEFNRALIMTQYDYRRLTVARNNYMSLSEKEEELWHELIDMFSKD